MKQIFGEISRRSEVIRPKDGESRKKIEINYINHRNKYKKLIKTKRVDAYNRLMEELSEWDSWDRVWEILKKKRNKGRETGSKR